MFLVMAVVLVIRPYGLFGKPEPQRCHFPGRCIPATASTGIEKVAFTGPVFFGCNWIAPPISQVRFQLILMTEIAIFALASV